MEFLEAEVEAQHTYLLEMSSSSPRVTRRAGRRARTGLLRGLT